MRVYYLNLTKISRNLIVLALLAATALLFSIIVRQNIPSTTITAGETIYKVQTKQKAVALTFNIQTGVDISPAIKALDQEQAKATFFIDPVWAENNTDTVRDISLKGHEIGILLNNENTGTDPAKYLPAIRKLFTQLTGSAPSLVRFNEQAPDSTGPEAVYSLGYQVIGSSKTLEDLSTSKEEEWLQPGNILCICLNNKDNQAIELISNMAETLRENKYCQVTLSELLTYGPGIVK